jgi:hypothetical protein
MKQKDIALIIVLAAVSAVVSFLLSDWLFAKPADRQQQVEKVDVITSDFEQPNARYFNAEAVNPTQNIKIGPGENPNPFDDKQ